MALFEGYERRIDQINAVLNSYGISSIEEAEKITKDAGLNVYDLSGILVCFDFQIPCLRKYLTADIQFSSIDFQKFKRGFFHEKP